MLEQFTKAKNRGGKAALGMMRTWTGRPVIVQGSSGRRRLMMRKTLLSVTVVLGMTAAASAQEWAEKMFDVQSHDFGTLARDAKAQFEFVVTNKYLNDIHIASARASCGCTQTEIKSPTLKTYEKGAIVATINTKAFRGQRGATITVTIDQPSYAVVQLHVKALILDDVVFNPSSVEFGDIDHGNPAEKWVAVSRSTPGDWRVLSVKTSSPHLSAEVVNSQRNGSWMTSQLRIRLDKDAPVGYLKDHLLLVTSDPTTQAIPLEIDARVVSSITVSPSSLFMGVVKPGERVTKQLVVQGKKPFRITSIKCNDALFQLGATSDTQSKPLHIIPITFIANASPGRVVQTIRIETDVENATPELSTYAVVAP
jgi:hypothetical protein